MSEIEQLKAEKQELKEEIVFLKKELECSKKLRNRIQNDLLKSDRINDNLKAENEIILDRLTQYEEDADVQVCLFSDLKRLEQENDNLKNKLSDAEAVMLTYKADKEKYYQQTLDDEIQINELLQTLQEIREIAEKVMLTELCNSCDGCGLIYGCNDTACAYYQMEKILQIINKAVEE